MSKASQARRSAQYRCGVDEAALTLEATDGDLDAAGLAASAACVAAGLLPLSRRQRQDIAAKAYRILWYHGWRATEPPPLYKVKRHPKPRSKVNASLL